MDRFLDIKKDFDSILELGSGAGHVCKYYQEPYSRWVLYDEARDLLFRDVALPPKNLERITGSLEVSSSYLAKKLPFKEGEFDAVASCLALHWVNDLPGTLIQVKHALKNDGVFMGLNRGLIQV